MEKVHPLPLISLHVSVRIKSASFHHTLNGATVFTKVVFVCPPKLCCFHLSTVATGE